jgi:hypothetical protein
LGASTALAHIWLKSSATKVWVMVRLQSLQAMIGEGHFAYLASEGSVL